MANFNETIEGICGKDYEEPSTITNMTEFGAEPWLKSFFPRAKRQKCNSNTQSSNGGDVVNFDS